MANDYAAMTAAELEAEIARTAAEIDALKARKRAAAAVLDSKLAEDAARRRLEAMSDPEREALRQILGAEGIPSGGAVGTPGL